MLQYIDRKKLKDSLQALTDNPFLKEIIKYSNIDWDFVEDLYEGEVFDIYFYIPINIFKEISSDKISYQQKLEHLFKIIDIETSGVFLRKIIIKPDIIKNTEPEIIDDDKYIPNENSSNFNTKVFIVHGRDNQTKQEVARYIETLNLEPIILHEQASSGMTIIEKIEHYANEASFGIVLYTPCDQGRGYHEKNFLQKIEVGKMSSWNMGI